jgi:hypothetical protein
LRTVQIDSAINFHHRAQTMRHHSSALLLSLLAASLIGSSAAAQSARDTLVQVKIERKTPVYETPSLAANTLVMAPPGQFSMRELVVQNGFIRIPLQSVKPSGPAIDGWITGAEVSARYVKVRVDTVTVIRADTVLRQRVDSVTVNQHPKEHSE